LLAAVREALAAPKEVPKRKRTSKTDEPESEQETGTGY
jgi:hypothetical protein